MARPDYDFTEATFRFFITLGRRPGAALQVALWQFVLYAGLVAIVLTSYWPLMTVVLQAAVENAEPSEADLFASMGGVWIGATTSVFGGILIALMIQGAWLRLLTHGETKPGIPIRLGGDEGRLFLVNLIFFAFVFIGTFVTLLVGGLLGAAVAAGVEAGGDGALFLAPIIVLIVLALLVFAVFIALRLAAAPAMSVNERRFRLFESFAATRRIWGWMLLSYMAVIAVGMVISSALSLFVGIAFFFAVSDLMAMAPELDMMAPAEALGVVLSRPGVIAALVVTVVVQIIYQILFEGSWHGVGAYAAVRHAGGDTPHEEVETPTASVGDAPSEG